MITSLNSIEAESVSDYQASGPSSPGKFQLKSTSVLSINTSVYYIDYHLDRSFKWVNGKAVGRGSQEEASQWFLTE